MYKKLGIQDLHAAIKNRVETGTDITCYDEVPKNAEAPFYYVEVVNVRPENTKISYRDVFTVWIHAIAEASNSSLGIYEMIQNLEEAMTEDISLPEQTFPVGLVMQASTGMQTLKKDETKEKHAVEGFEFTVVYGYKTK